MRYILAFALTACGAEPLRPDWAPDLGPCDLESLEVDMSSGTPVFRWQGSASDVVVGQSLSIEEPTDDYEWAIQCLEDASWEDPEFGYTTSVPRNCIPSGVTYGEANGAFEFVFPSALVSGETYDVAVVQWCDSEVAPDFVTFGGMVATFVAP